MNTKCRTCLNESSKGMQSLTKIYTDESNRQKSFAEILNEVANINIQNDKYSKLPQAICRCCLRKLKEAHAFVQQAQEVNVKLYSMFLQIDNIGKSSDCLHEEQIDIVPRARVKAKGINKYNVRVVGVSETDFLKKNIKLKVEDPEENILAATSTKTEDLEEGKHLKDVKYPDISITTEMSDVEGRFRNIFQHTSDDSRNNSKSPSESVSDDNDWQIKSNNSRKKSVQKKVKSIKKVKKSPKDDEIKEREKGNEDECLQVRCNDCGKIFANSRLLKQHLGLNHVPDELKIQCLHCEAKFSRRPYMYAHMRRIHKTENLDEFQIQPKKVTVERKYVCQQCPRSYIYKYKLTLHVNRHHNPDNKNNPPKQTILLPQKRFLCPFCGSQFDREGHLNVHIRRHTGEKPFKCEFCDRAYPRLYDVTVHRRSHTGEKPYQCTVCSKSFRNSNRLQMHMSAHSNERPHKCTQCEKAFKQPKDLKIHKRKHTGERPYICGVCNSTFAQTNSLRIHQINLKHLKKPNVPESSSEGTTLTSGCHFRNEEKRQPCSNNG